MSVSANVRTVMVDCNDLDRMVAFWGELLDLEPVAHYPGYVFMSKVSENGPALAFQQVPEPRAGKNRLHLDLVADDPEGCVARVIELGGSRVEDHELDDGFHWTVLTDPEGNVFCVTGQ